jgi:hypothetical protein
MRLAGLFVLVVVGLIILSSIFKIIFLVKDSRFDGAHKFNIEFVGKNKVSLVSFSPQGKTVSILNVGKRNDDAYSKSFGIIIDGKIVLKNDLESKDISTTLLTSTFPFGNKVNGLTTIDLARLFLFSRTVSQNSTYERDLLEQYNEAQKSTIISLSFTDPQIYQENQSIEIVNATSVFGLGGRLATLINNLGGNVILVTSEKKEINNSKIKYSGEKTYTVKRLGEYLGLPLEQMDKKGISDVIIVIGKDKAENDKF